jgi:cytochrome c oxidase subunit 2
MPAALMLRRSRLPFRPLVLALFGVVILMLVVAPGAFADALTPESGGGTRNAEDIDTLYKIAFGLGILIFLLVEGVLIYVLINHRRKRGGPEPAQIRGNTTLEVGWTIGAAVLLVILGTVTFLYLGNIKNPAPARAGGLNAQANQFAAIDQADPPGDPKRALHIDVTGQQYLWRYTYPNGSYAFYDMVVPYDTTVVLNITSSDVDHSWWIPKLGGKADAIPRYNNHTWFQITEHGHTNYGQFTGASIFNGNCAELCGENHAEMRMRVIAVPVDQYQQWVTRQKQLITESQNALTQQRKAMGTHE